MRIRIWMLALAAVLTAGLAMPAAASPPADEARAEQPPTDAQALEARARAYWQARVAGDRAVLDFYAPPEKGGPKRSRDISEFGNVGYRDWEIRGVEVNGDEGVVTIEVETNLPVPLPPEVASRLRRRALHERWQKIDGVWYKRPIPRGFSTHRANAPEAATKTPSGGTEEPAPPAKEDNGAEAR